MRKTAKDRKRRAQRRLLRKQLDNIVPVSDNEEEVKFEAPGEGALRHRAGKLSEIIVMYPGQIAMSLAARDESHWIFGRLYLVGVISYDQLLASERLQKAVITYRKLLIRHGSIRIADPEREAMRVGGSKSEDLSPLAEKRLERATKEYDRNILTLKDCSPDVADAVIRAMDNDSLGDMDLEMIRRGLEALVRSAPYVIPKRKVATA